MTGLELVLLSTLINYAVNILSFPDPEPICSVKTYITYDDETTEVQRPVYCKDIGL
ncbi:hypothetical protein MED121_20801 [Marinomonas sp. MED121]|uniref:hypothetical protein n=1 Tax=Marinomonas sp. MED121 TaxID=314277 RepID=UPI0000690A0B|nr:hypothetical protein [Marinomonas sp. MED121]EAQ64048.1 hypothetical protein MED121_20801 [Marinomonas sp. MED121]